MCCQLLKFVNRNYCRNVVVCPPPKEKENILYYVTLNGHDRGLTQLISIIYHWLSFYLVAPKGAVLWFIGWTPMRSAIPRRNWNWSRKDRFFLHPFVPGDIFLGWTSKTSSSCRRGIRSFRPRIKPPKNFPPELRSHFARCNYRLIDELCRVQLVFFFSLSLETWIKGKWWVISNCKSNQSIFRHTIKKYSH